VTCRPAKELVLSKEKPIPYQPPLPPNEAPSGVDAAAGVTPVGLRPPFVTPAAAHSHPDCRGIPILIVAPQEPLIPPGKRGGGKRTVIMREVVNGLMYVLSTGCQWRAIPKDLPPRSSVYGYFDLWTYDGTLERIHCALYERCREREQREASPTAAIIDSQSVKSAEKGGRSLIRMDTMRARSDNEDVALKSRARSGTFLSTH
jgi:transposase